MIDRWKQKQTNPMGRREDENPSSDRVLVGDDSEHRHGRNSRNHRLDAKGKLPLALVCAACVIYNHVNSVNAFSIFRPQSIPTTKAPSSTARFLFSFRNDNNGGEREEDELDTEPTTATLERTNTNTNTPAWNPEEESEDFSSWMEGLRLGTPLGKMASSPSTVTSPEEELGLESEPLLPKAVTVNSVSLRESKQKQNQKLQTAETKAKANTTAKTMAATPTATEASTTKPMRMDDTPGRRKLNPLSNLIQFEAMLELAKIAGSKETGTTEPDQAEASSSSNSSSASATDAFDVFAVVDNLVKTFQTQEEKQQTERKELLQLAQLETTVPRKDDATTANDQTVIGDAATTNTIDEVSAATTVNDLMELDRYVGGLDFPKVSNIWDTFSGNIVSSYITKEEDVTEEDGIVGMDQESIPSIPSSNVSAAASPLFRGKETDDSTSTNLAQAAESILKDTTSKMEYLVAEASSSRFFEPSESRNSTSTSSSASALQDLVGRASSVFNNTAIVETISNDIVAAAQKIAKESGVDINVQFAADRAREATEYAVGVAATANMVLDAGYAYGSRSGAAGMSMRDGDLNYLAASAASQTAGSVLSADASGGSSSSSDTLPAHQPPLFGDFDSAQRIEPYEYANVVHQGAEMGSLAGAIYENTLLRTHKLGHSLVANGTTANVAWMVTDSVMDRERFASAFCHHDDAMVSTTRDTPEDSKDDNNNNGDDDARATGPVMVRTITMRGFDASDESVDREALLNEICFAPSEPMDDATAETVVFHKGLLNIARQIYAETKQYIDWTSPDHKIVLNGHSVGGSLSVLMLLLITSERGVDFTRERILRAYSHGSPPVAALVNPANGQSTTNSKFRGTQQCPVLEAFDLPPSMVYGFIQPYDPVVRLFSNHDVLYPLVDDLGKDGITLYSSGPIRSLRPITRAIFQAWDGWPQFRDNWKGTCDMEYHSVGIQHLLLPEPLRYLNDRFISVNVGVPPVDAIVRISPEELLPALDKTFPLDTFKVSLVPEAVRSFLHHFYPAYDASIADYAAKVKYQAKMDAARKSSAFKPFQTTKS